MDRQQLGQKWQDFMEDDDYGYVAQAMAVADAFPDQRSLWVKCNDLEDFDPEFLDYVLKNPEHTFQVAQETILEVLPVDLRERVERHHIKIHLRIKGAPGDKFVDIRDIRHEHVGKYLSISGIIKRASEIRPRLLVGSFQCARCGHITGVTQEGMHFIEPQVCDIEQDGCGKTLAQTTFKLLVERSAYVDTQFLEIQEELEGLRGGAQPQSLQIWMEDDIVGTVFPGDRVRLNGILAATQKRKGSEKTTQFDIHLVGVSVEREKTDYEAQLYTDEDLEELTRLKNDPNLPGMIRDSIAPTIYGHTEIKEALALQLFGGVEKTKEGRARLRGDMHILLIGDPGTAKSQLLRQVAAIAPRGIYASGKSASAAGLTAAAVKDDASDGRWTLEAGVLVLADEGTACIDEMDKMSTQDRSSMHEAMEQQTVTVAKAGITATLRSRCSMLGAANPKKGRFDEFDTPVDQIDMPPTLLSRFDLIFKLTDKPSAKDADIAEHILSVHEVGAVLEQKKHKINLPSEIDPDILEKQEKDITAPVETEMLRKYVGYAKSNCYPVLTPDSKRAIKEFYLDIRKLGEGVNAAIPITARQLEGIVRLSEASARMSMSPVVREKDVKRATGVMMFYLNKLASEDGSFDVDRIMTTFSHKQRGAASGVREIIANLILDSKEGVSKEEILAHAQEQGLSTKDAGAMLDKLIANGELYEGRGRKYRLVNR